MKNKTKKTGISAETKENIQKIIAENPDAADLQFFGIIFGFKPINQGFKPINQGVIKNGTSK
jgi:hypothetical protein